MRLRGRRSTKPSSSSVRVTSLLVFLALVACLEPAAAAESAGAIYARALDAYFDEEPYRALVLIREAANRPDAKSLRQPALYLTGKCFASIHLYEKAEDALRLLLEEAPRGRFAPAALRELARIFFDLREFAAVVNLETAYRGDLPSVPAEVSYVVGQSNYLLGRNQEARAVLARVPRGEFFPFARFTIAQVEFTLDRPDDAIGDLGKVIASPAAPPLLRDKARRIAGMIQYQRKRYRESMGSYRSIGQKSRLFSTTRIDLALAAEAAGDAGAVREALRQAMDGAADDGIRAEAQVAFGRIFNREASSETARTLFEQAIADLRTRERRLREAVEVEERFGEVFADLIAFARQGQARWKRARLAEDLSLLGGTAERLTGSPYEHDEIEGPSTLSPRSVLFPLLLDHFHDRSTIETFVDLSVELEDLEKSSARLAEEIRGHSSAFRSDPPAKASEVDEDVRELPPQIVWLALAQYDLTSRLYDALAMAERIDPDAAVVEKRRALASTTRMLRLVLAGRRDLPSKASLLSMMSRARDAIANEGIPGLASETVRQGLLEEWRTDRDSLEYVLDNLDLKERQMASALAGVPLRSRNLNLPVLTAMIDWLTALERLESKYRWVAVEPAARPWHLAGRADDLVRELERSDRDLAVLRGRAVTVLRGEARQLVQREGLRQSLIVAQAEDGIADALFEARNR
ncbi:MAG: hypothetical protein QOD06_214 [Candidatus Binatota bacterium]|nr:hypothetical protein [Candidatus Binatota bacterium]